MPELATGRAVLKWACDTKGHWREREQASKKWHSDCAVAAYLAGCVRIRNVYEAWLREPGQDASRLVAGIQEALVRRAHDGAERM